MATHTASDAELELWLHATITKVATWRGNWVRRAIMGCTEWPPADVVAEIIAEVTAERLATPRVDPALIEKWLAGELDPNPET